MVICHQKGVHILSATVSERNRKWHVSLQVEQEMQVSENQGPVVGIDLGILRLITVSDGTIIENPRALPRNKRKLERLQRAAARRNYRSHNWAKVNRRIARYHLRIHNIRRDAIHKATTMLARTKSGIGAETLGIREMMANHRLAGALADASFGEVIRQLRYKTEWYGSSLVLAASDFPSTRRCSACGWVNPEPPLSQRVLRCEQGDLVMDRDLNAAKNNEQVAIVALSCRETVNARQSRGVTARGASALGAVPGDEAGTISLRKALKPGLLWLPSGNG